jgi:ferredoxin
MRVRVNLATCQGIGLCEAHAPGVFELADRGYATAIAGEVPADDQDDVTTAARSCPTGSISILD